MEKVTVTLTESMQRFVAAQIAAGGFRSAAEYLEALVRKAQKEQARHKVDLLLGEGIEAKASVTSQEWEKLEQEVRDSHYDLKLF